MELRQSDYENYDYRDFWQDNQRLYEDTSERIALRKMLAPIRDRSGIFADIGCGYGRLFAEYQDFHTILLLDYSMKNLKIAKAHIRKYLHDKKKLSSVHFIAADALSLPLRADIVDVLLTVRVVHHLANPQLYFDQAHRVLKRDGTFVLEFANKRNTKNIFRSMAGKMDTSPFNLKPSRVGDTILNYHPAYILDMLQKKNFVLQKRLSVSNFRLQLAKKIIPFKVLLFLENLYQKGFSFLSLGPSIFLRTQLLKKQPPVQVSSLEHILVCPQCPQDTLKIEDHQAICNGCGRQYPRQQGIFDFK